MTASLTLQQVRDVHLNAQGLSGVPGPAPAAAASRERVLTAIERMAALQIDSISVVARSPYLVLWSRVGDYSPAELDSLLSGGHVFEYWAHAACFLPSRDFAAYRAFAAASVSARQRYTNKWLGENEAFATQVLSRIERDGPLRSSDFERSDGRKGTGWWDWKEEKMVLEALFNAGVLLVRERHNFQRIYDLAERVRPDAATPPPSLEEARRALILRAASALGVARADWVAEYLFLGQPKTPIVKTVREMARAGELTEVVVDGWRESGYAVPGWEAHATTELETRQTTVLLSPFDPVVWNRERLLELFGFDYRIECYTPEPKRKYGYFNLPILHNGAMVGRLDPKAHRKAGVMEIKALHLEPGVKPTVDLVEGLRDTLKRFAAWHGTPEVTVTGTNPASLKRALRIR